MKDEVEVIIVGAGPSGLATAACLNRLSIPYIILEREDCFGSIWKKYAYDRLHLHLKKQYCELPHMSFPPDFPDYVPKDQFIHYLDTYAAHFQITPLCTRLVESAVYDDEVAGKWRVGARNSSSGEVEEYCSRFLVVASGEATDPFIPEVEGMNGFPGKVIHSTQFWSGKEFEGMNVLAVGSGNSGMEIALDLANHGARTSIVVRSAVHVVSRNMVALAFILFRHIPFDMVDSIMILLSKLIYGDMTKYGIRRPAEGPFFLKDNYGKYPIVDVGTIKKIKSGEIQVLPSIKKIEGNMVQFDNGKSHPFDAIVFCTGFKRSTANWLKGGNDLLNEEGLSKHSHPNSYKGKNGLYCAGLARKGLYGASSDALGISKDIKDLLQSQ